MTSLRTRWNDNHSRLEVVSLAVPAAGADTPYLNTLEPAANRPMPLPTHPNKQRQSSSELAAAELTKGKLILNRVMSLRLSHPRIPACDSNVFNHAVVMHCGTGRRPEKHAALIFYRSRPKPFYVLQCGSPQAAQYTWSLISTLEPFDAKGPGPWPLCPSHAFLPQYLQYFRPSSSHPPRSCLEPLGSASRGLCTLGGVSGITFGMLFVWMSSSACVVVPGVNVDSIAGKAFVPILKSLIVCAIDAPLVNCRHKLAMRGL